MEHRLMPDRLDIREITFTNLLLLGFEPNVYEAKYKCPFNRDMFAFPNKKAMEAVFYFLFNKLNSDVTRDEFRNCWPIYDKKQESAFRKVAAAWLNRISKECYDSHLPRVVASVLLSPGGDKFYNLLFCFSSYVLKEDLKRVGGKDNIVLPWPSSSPATKSLRPQISAILTTKMVCETNKFLEHIRLCSTTQDQWVSYASDLTKENRSIRKSKRDLEKSLKEIEAEHLRRGLLSPAPGTRHQQGSPYAGEVKSLKRTKIIQRVRVNWKRVQEIYEAQQLLRERINEMVKGNSGKYCLSGSNIDIKIPDLLIRDCDEEIYQKRIENTYDSGRVNLLSLVQLWNLSLHLLLEQFQTHPLPAVAKEEQDVRKELHNQSGYLQSIKSLKEILEQEMIPELKDSIDELKETLNHQQVNNFQRTPKTVKGFDFGLTGLPATPSVQLDTSQPHEDQFVAFTKELFPNESVPTPEAIEKMMQSLRDISLTQKKDAVIPDEKPAVSSLRQRIPMPKAKTTVKPKSRNKLDTTRDVTFKKPRLIDATPVVPFRTTKKPVTQASHDARTRQAAGRKQVGAFRADQKNPVEKAQDILADKIASSVLSRQSSSGKSSSNSSRCTTPQDHGLADPLSAMADDAFHPRDELPRTPSVKASKELYTDRKSVDDFASYLAFTATRDPTSPARQLFSESFTATPLHSMTPKQVDSYYHDDFLEQQDLVFASPRATQDVLWNTGTGDKDVSRGTEDLMPKIPASSEIYPPFTAGNRGQISYESPFQTTRLENDISLAGESSIFRDKDQFNAGDSSKYVSNFAESRTELSLPRSDLTPESAMIGSGADAALRRLGDASTIEGDQGTHMDKSDLDDIIKRFRLLKSKSQAIEKTKMNSSIDGDLDLLREPVAAQGAISSDSRRCAGTPEKLDQFDVIASRNYEGDESSRHRKAGDACSSDHLSFFEKTMSSADKEALLWKANVSMDLSETNGYTDAVSVVDSDLPVAKQLSFLQIDTRDLPRKTHGNAGLAQAHAASPAEDRHLSNGTPMTHVENEDLHDFLGRSIDLDVGSPSNFLLLESPLDLQSPQENSFNLLTPRLELRRGLWNPHQDPTFPSHDPTSSKDSGKAKGPEIAKPPAVANLIDLEW